MISPCEFSKTLGGWLRIQCRKTGAPNKTALFDGLLQWDKNAQKGVRNAQKSIPEDINFAYSM